MFVSENLGVNEKGHLTAGGIDTVELAKQYGTPLYVMDEALIRKHCQSYKNSIDKFYGGEGLVCYASKAFCCMEMCRVMKDEGIGLDVVSIGELYTAEKAGFDCDKICFHGNNKTDEELEYAVDLKVGRIIVDNIYELKRLDKIAENKGVKANIMFRIKPGIDAHTHNFIRTGQIDSKFGFALETGEAMEAVKMAISCPNINLKGVHCHIGSQIFSINPFVEAAEVMLKFIADIKNETGHEVVELNLGGGFGIKYTENDDPVPYEAYMEKVSAAVKESCEKLGMTDNPRYALYQSEYEALVANKADKPRDTKVTIAGKCCESGDLIGEGMPLQEAEPGDIIAVCATGAYNYSMSSNYNRIPKPATVFINNGESRVVIKRETLDDIIRNDM